MEDQKRPVLLLLPTKLLRNAVLRYIKNGGDKYKRYDFTIIADDDLDKFSFKGLYDEVASRIRSLPIPPLVIPTHDKGALVHAALAHEFGYIVAPSVLAEFIAFHKGETYKVIPTKYVMPTLQLEADADIGQERLLQAGLMKFPMFIKPSMGTNSDLVQKVDNMEKLKTILARGRSIIPKFSTGVEEIVSKFVSDNSLESAMMNAWILQPFIACPGNGRLCNVEGMVYNGEISVWVIQESLFWETAPTALKCSFSPPELELILEENLKQAYYDIITELVVRGFNNQFANLEAFVLNNGMVHISEVNARTARVNWRSYLGLHKENGDTLVALLSLAEGVAPEKPLRDTNRHACLAYVSVFGEGKAKDFINLDKARSIEQFDLRCDEESDISCIGEWGFQLGYCYTFGHSRSEATENARELIAEVVTAKNACLWTS